VASGTYTIAVTFSQTDLTGDWDGIFFRAGSGSGWHWQRVAHTLNGSGGITVTSSLDSTGTITLPAPGSIIWTISAAGVVSEGGAGGDASFHGQISSNKLLVIGTSNGSGNSAELRVVRKRTGTAFSNADLANISFVSHSLSSGTDNTWEWALITTDSARNATLLSRTTPSGTESGPFPVVHVLSVDAFGIVTDAADPSYFGIMTNDKRVVFSVNTADSGPSGNKYMFDVFMVTGQTYTQSDYAGIRSFSTIRNNVPNPGWAYGVGSIDAAGNGTYLSYTDSGGGATPAGFTRVLSASGVITDPADATAHGQMSYNKDIHVRTNTLATGRYGIIIGLRLR
jgi:hypothetical protein